MQVQDAKVNADVLDDLVPLHGRWPDPRVLTEQDASFWLRDGERIDLIDMTVAEVAWLLDWLVQLAPRLHRRAVDDERLTTSSGLRRAFGAAGIPLVEETDVFVWLESTRLMRALRAKGP